MNCLKRLQRLFSGVVVVTFFVTNTLTPAPIAYGQTVENPAKFFSESSFRIPAEFGKVTDRIPSSEGSPLLIHIQEAHANYDAQANIKNILQHLSKNYGVKLVLLEGAGNKLRPGLFNFFPKNVDLQQAVNEKLMRAGELTGAEAFLIDEESATHNAQRATEGKRSLSAPEAFGVEDAGAYAENREAYRKVYEGRQLSENFLESFYRQWQKSADQVLNKSLRELLDRETSFEEERLPLQDWMAFLKTAAVRDLKLDLEDVSAQQNWPVLVRYFRLQKTSAQIDQAKARKEQEAFLADLHARQVPAPLLQEITDLLEHKNAGDLPLYKTRFAFEKLMDILPKDYSFEAYLVFRLYLQQLILLSELQSEKLQEEIRTLTGKMTASYLKTEEERKLVEVLHRYRLLKKLFGLELSREEFRDLQSQQMTPEKIAVALGLNSAKLSPITSLFGTAIHFYEGAIVREDYMMRRVREVMGERKETKAVIITGGFHTEGFKEKIIASGNAYVGITPTIGEITQDSKKNYLSALFGSNAILKSHIAPEMITQQSSFFQAVSPRFWRRELAVRFVRIRELVRQAVASFGDRAEENRAEFEAGFQNLIASAVGVPAQLQPVKVATRPTSSVRSEVRAKNSTEDRNWDLHGAAMRALLGIQRDPVLSSEYGQIAQTHREALNRPDWTAVLLGRTVQFIRDSGGLGLGVALGSTKSELMSVLSGGRAVEREVIAWEVNARKIGVSIDGKNFFAGNREELIAGLGKRNIQARPQGERDIVISGAPFRWNDTVLLENELRSARSETRTDDLKRSSWVVYEAFTESLSSEKKSLRAWRLLGELSAALPDDPKAALAPANELREEFTPGTTSANDLAELISVLEERAATSSRSEAREITIDLTEYAFEDGDTLTIAGLLKWILLEDKKISESELREFGVVKVELFDSQEVPEKHRGKRYSFERLSLEELDFLLKKMIGVDGGALFREVVLERRKIAVRPIVLPPSVKASGKIPLSAGSGEVQAPANGPRKIYIKKQALMAPRLKEGDVPVTIGGAAKKTPPKKSSKAWLWITLAAAGLVIGGIILAVTKPWEKQKPSDVPAATPTSAPAARSEVRLKGELSVPGSLTSAFENVGTLVWILLDQEQRFFRITLLGGARPQFFEAPKTIREWNETRFGLYAAMSALGPRTDFMTMFDAGPAGVEIKVIAEQRRSETRQKETTSQKKALEEARSEETELANKIRQDNRILSEQEGIFRDYLETMDPLAFLEWQETGDESTFEENSGFSELPPTSQINSGYNYPVFAHDHLGDDGRAIGVRSEIRTEKEAVVQRLLKAARTASDKDSIGTAPAFWMAVMEGLVGNRPYQQAEKNLIRAANAILNQKASIPEDEEGWKSLLGDPLAFEILMGTPRSEMREGEPNVKNIDTWTEAFAAIRWISEQEDISKHIGLIRQISLRLRERKKELTLNRSRDYDQYPEDIAEDALTAAALLLRRTKKEFRRPIKELVIAMPYFFKESSSNLHYVLWSFAADLDERLLGTKFARNLRHTVHGASFSYGTLFLVRAYLYYLETGDAGALGGHFMIVEDADRALRKELEAMTPEDREQNEIYQALKKMETALMVLFEGTYREDVFKEWLQQSFVKNTPALSQALQEILEAPPGEPRLRTQKIIAARELILGLEDRTDSSAYLYHLYHLDRSLGQLMSLSLADFFDRWDQDGDRSILEAIGLMRKLTEELFNSGFITSYTAQWVDLLGDRALTFDQLGDVLSVVEREIRSELAKWGADYYEAATTLCGEDYERIDNIIALIRKEKFATMAAFKLLEKLKEKVEQKKGRDARAFLNPEVAERLFRQKEEDPFGGILHVDDFKTPNYVSRSYEKKTYGGKGSYLMRMNSMGLPIPSAFVIPSHVGKYGWQKAHGEAFPSVLRGHLEKLEKDWSSKIGTPVRYGNAPSTLFGEGFEPLFLSVRSGAVFVMPGIFETAVSVGFSPEILQYEIEKRGPRPALSAYLSFIESIGVSLGVPREEFEQVLHLFMKDKEVRNWGDLKEKDLLKIEKAMIQLLKDHNVFDRYEVLYRNPEKQLEFLIDKVFESWNAPKAKRYRREKNISDEWNTPVIVQAYVFGDRDENSGAGIALSHDRQGGGKIFGGEWLPFAHGMTMMQGRLEPKSLEVLKQRDPASFSALEANTMKLEKYFGVPQMVEFTIESGKPWILQTVYDQRVGHDESFPELDWNQISKPKKIGEGNVAFGESGALRGFVVFEKADAIRADVLEKVKKDPNLDAVIFASFFPTTEDSPDVISAHKILRAVGKRLILLTAQGGLTSHAAVVANYESIPTLVSVKGLEIDKAKGVTLGGQLLDESDTITIDFGTGNIYLGNLPRLPEAKSSSRSEVRENENAEMDVWKHHWRGFGEKSEADVLVAGPAGFFVSRASQKAQGTILQSLSAPPVLAVGSRVPFAEIPNAKLAGFDMLTSRNKRSEVRRDIRALMEERVKGLDSTYPKMVKIWEIVAETSRINSSFEKINAAKDVAALVVAFEEAKAVLAKTLRERRSSILLRVFDFTKSELWVYPTLSTFFAAIVALAPGEIRWITGLAFIASVLWGVMPSYIKWFLGKNQPGSTYGKRLPLSKEADLYDKLLLDALDRIMVPTVIREENAISEAQRLNAARSETRINMKAGEEEVRTRLKTLTGNSNPAEVRRRAEQFLSQPLVSGGRKGSADLARAREFINEVATSRSEVRIATEEKWVQATKPRLAKQHLYSRQWECGLPMDLLEKIEKLYSAFEAGEISQVTLTGGLGALMPDLFEAWAAIGMNVTGIHPLWNFIKNKPLKGTDAQGVRKLLGQIAKQQMEDTGIKFDVRLNVLGNAKTVSFRVYKTYSKVHQAPHYYLDAYVTRADGKEEPAFLEVYDDEGKREVDMAFFSEASELLIQTLEKSSNPDKVILLDHEVFVSLPVRHLKKAKRATLNHTVFRPGLFEAWDGYYELFNFPEWLRSTITHDGKISIADFTAEVFHLISGVGLVEHLPALLKNIFRTAWHRVKGYFDPEKEVRSTNGIFLPRWQSPQERELIEHYKTEMKIQKPGFGLPSEANDREFYRALEQHPDLRERFKAQNEWVGAADGATLLIWLREKRGFKDAYDWLGNTFKDYQEKHGMTGEALVMHLNEMQELLQKATRENLPEDWARLETEFGEARDLTLGDPIVANVRRQVPYKGPDKYEEVEHKKVLEALETAAREANGRNGLPGEFKGRPDNDLFKFWKAYRAGTDKNEDRFQKEFLALRNRLKEQPSVEQLRKILSRVLIGGRTFDLKEAHDRFLYIRFLAELLGLEDRIATLEDYNYYEAQIIFRGVQGGMMLSDEDLEASATSMMKVLANRGEVMGVFGGANPEVWIIRVKATGEIIRVLNDKGEPNSSVITHDIMRKNVQEGKWEVLNGIPVWYDDSEQSTQEGGLRRPAADSLVKALQKIKTLRSDPATRRERMYQCVAAAWRVDMVTGQAMGQAQLLEDMLQEIEEREDLLSQIHFQSSDYAALMKAPDFVWQGMREGRTHSAAGAGLFGMFRSFREIKTWQRPNPKKSNGFDPATRGMDAQDSLRQHVKKGDIFKYILENLQGISSGVEPLRRRLKEMEAEAARSDEKQKLILNLEAMDLTEMLLVRMAGDWFERYMASGTGQAELLRKELTQNIGKEYQPWAEYLSRYLDGHSDASSLRTHDHKIQAFVFAPKGKKPVLVNLNLGAPVKFEEDSYFRGYKARTQVIIDEAAFNVLVEGEPDVQFVKVREPKIGQNYRIHAKENSTTVLGIGVSMPLGVEILELQPVPYSLLSSSLVEPVRLQKQWDASPLKQLIRQTRVGYESPEGAPIPNYFSEQLETLASDSPKEAAESFGDKIRPTMTLLGLFRPDLVNTPLVSSWNSSFHTKLSHAVADIQTALGEDAPRAGKHHFYVLDASHKSSLVLAEKNVSGDVVVAAIQLDAASREIASDGKVSTQVSAGLEQIIEPGTSYRMHDLLTGIDYGERNDLLQGWNLRIPFGADGDRVQILLLKKQTTAARSEVRDGQSAKVFYSLTIIDPRKHTDKGRTETWIRVIDQTGREGWYQSSALWVGSASRKGDMILNTVEIRKEHDGTPIFTVPKRVHRSETRGVNSLMKMKTEGRDVFQALARGEVDTEKSDQLIKAAKANLPFTTFVLSELIRLRSKTAPRLVPAADQEALRISRAIRPVRQAPRSEVRAIAKDQVRTIDPNEWFFVEDLGRTLASLTQVVRQAEADRRQVRLIALSSTTDQDELLSMLGFAPLSPRQDQERAFLGTLAGRLAPDTGFSFIRTGSNVALSFSTGESVALVLTNRKYSNTFENLLNNALQGIEKQRGIESFDTEVQKGGIRLKNPMNLEYALTDETVMAKELGLEPELVANALITQAEYAELPATKPVEKAPATKSVEPSAQAKSLSKVLADIQAAWDERESHWAVQRVKEDEAALTAWDALFKAHNDKTKEALRASEEKASIDAQMIYQAMYHKSVPAEEIQSAKETIRKLFGNEFVDETPYGKILQSEAALQALIQSPVDQADADALEARSEKIFRELVKLQNLIRNRTLAFSKYPVRGVRPELQYFFIKDIVQLHFLQKVSASLLNGNDKELAEFSVKMLRQQTKIHMVKKEGEGKTFSSDGVDPVKVLAALTDLKAFVKERKAFYDASHPSLGQTVGRIYGEVLEMNANLPAMESEKEFALRLRQMLDLLVTIWSSDQTGLWSTGMSASFKMDETTKARFQKIMEQIMIPLLMDTPGEVRTYAFGEKLSNQPRSEIRTKALLETPAPVLSYDDLIRENVRMGGGLAQGFRGVTEKLTDGIISLAPYTLDAKAVAMILNTLVPTAFAQETFDVAAPATPQEQKRFTDAAKILLRDKILKASDVLVLAPEFAIEHGAALVIRKILGDVPVAVLVRNNEDRVFLEEINAQLRLANRPLLLPAGDLDEARRLLGKEVQGRNLGTGALNIKAMVYFGEKSLQAAELLKTYGDAIVTPERFQRFLNVAGISETVTQMRDQYLATARSA